MRCDMFRGRPWHNPAHRFTRVKNFGKSVPSCQPLADWGLRRRLMALWRNGASCRTSSHNIYGPIMEMSVTGRVIYESQGPGRGTVHAGRVMLQLKVCMLGVNFGVFLLWVGMKWRADVIYRCHVMRSAMLGLFL